MKLEWSRKAHIYKAGVVGLTHGKARAFLLLEDRIRTYPICYQAKNGDGLTVSQSYRLDLERDKPETIVSSSDEPILQLGQLGTFDEHGIMAECAVYNDGTVYMYYDGWSRCSSVPYNWAIGLALSKDQGITFEKVGPGPIVGPTADEPFLQASPTVLIDERGVWHMWYLSGSEWRTAKSGFDNLYVIKHAVSLNGIDWERNGRAILPVVLDEECQAGATVFRLRDRYHMIFSYRYGSDFRNGQRGYRLGYAYSDDLEIWARNDALLSIEAPDTSWDSEMMCYPSVLESGGRHLLFYSGNDFGREGFGYAELAVQTL